MKEKWENERKERIMLEKERKEKEKKDREQEEKERYERGQERLKKSFELKEHRKLERREINFK